MDTRIFASLASSLRILGIVIMAAGTALRAWYFRGPWDEAARMQRLAKINAMEIVLLVGILLIAPMMARGLWLLP